MIRVRDRARFLCAGVNDLRGPAVPTPPGRFTRGRTSDRAASAGTVPSVGRNAGWMRPLRGEHLTVRVRLLESRGHHLVDRVRVGLRPDPVQVGDGRVDQVLEQLGVTLPEFVGHDETASDDRSADRPEGAVVVRVEDRVADAVPDALGRGSDVHHGHVDPPALQRGTESGQAAERDAVLVLPAKSRMFHRRRETRPALRPLGHVAERRPVEGCEIRSPLRFEALRGHRHGARTDEHVDHEVHRLASSRALGRDDESTVADLGGSTS